jgi:hypothetical protein
MPLNYLNLDTETRNYMRRELENDLAQNDLYLSSRLNPKGLANWHVLLGEAIDAHDDAWLAARLQEDALLNAVEVNRKTGTTKRVPSNANETLAEGEFNRFYIRGVCVRAIAEGFPDVIIYRAKAASQPRMESQELIGTTISAEGLLADLRKNIGIETALGIPPGPNSGISVHLP